MNIVLLEAVLEVKNHKLLTDAVHDCLHHILLIMDIRISEALRSV